jgi:ribosomal protein S27E
MTRSDHLPVPAPGTMRCRCAACGSHVTVHSAYRIAGQCGNCGSYEMQPMDEAPPSVVRPPAA